MVIPEIINFSQYDQAPKKKKHDFNPDLYDG